MYRFPDVYVRPPLFPINWSYHANLSFQPYKAPVTSSGKVVVQKSKTKQIVVADDPKDDVENDPEDIENNSAPVDE